MQGVVKSYDPSTQDGMVMCDRDFEVYDIAPGALAGTVFRMLRQGQRICFELDDQNRAISLSLGSEIDIGTPGFPASEILPASTRSQ